MLWLMFYFFFNFIYLFLDREEGWEKERERSHKVWLPLTHPLLGTWHEPQACALHWESNQRPFGLQAGTQLAELHQPGWCFNRITGDAVLKINWRGKDRIREMFRNLGKISAWLSLWQNRRGNEGWWILDIIKYKFAYVCWWIWCLVGEK